MARAVVPIHADLLRATADARDAGRRACDAGRRNCAPQTRACQAFSPSHLRAARDRTSRNASPSPSIDLADRARRQLAMLERARNAFAHQRIDTGRVTGENDASGCVAVARVEPSNRERMPSSVAPSLQAVERKFGERRDEFGNHPRLLARSFRRIRAGADRRCRRSDAARPSIKAWERPAVAADSAAHASEVEPVAFPGKFGRALGIDCDVRHQCAPDCLLARAEYRPTDPAARSVGSHQHLRFVDAAARCRRARRVASWADVEHAIALDDFDSRLACRSRQHRVEPVAANHRAQHLAAARQIDVADGSRALRPRITSTRAPRAGCQARRARASFWESARRRRP